MSYLCPVCGYDAMETAPADYAICPCCGTEFGYDDVAHTLEELRNDWIFAGARWFSDHTPPPPNWSASSQLEKLYRRQQTIERVELSQPFLGTVVEEKSAAETTIVKVVKTAA